MLSASPKLSHYALGATLACVLLNPLLRLFVHLPGPLATLLVAAVVAAGLALSFRWRQARRPEPAERRVLVGLYALTLGLLYAALLLLMAFKDTPSPAALLLFAVHYFAYPLLAWFALAPER